MTELRVKPHTLKWAIGLGAVGTLFFGLFLGPTSAALSILALVTISKNPEKFTGKHLATVMLIVSIAVTGFSGYRVIRMVGKAGEEISYRQIAVESLQRGKTIRKACLAFANDNNGSFPDDLYDLVDTGYLESEEQLRSPLSRFSDEPHLYKFLLPNKRAEALLSQKVVMIQDSYIAKDGRQVTVFADGSGGAYPPEEIRAFFPEK